MSNESFNIILTEIKVSDNICEILDECFKYVNKHKKIFQEKYKSQLEDYRYTDKKEKTKCVNGKLSK